MQPKIFPSELAALEAIETAVCAAHPGWPDPGYTKRARELAYVLQRLGLIDWQPGAIEKSPIDSPE